MGYQLLIGVAGVVGLFTLLILGVPIGFTLAIIGVIGTSAIIGLGPAMSQITLLIWGEGTNYIMVAIPLFIFMGQIATTTGIADDLFDCLMRWMGRFKSGLPITAVFACGGFGAVTGSSVATVATMGKIIYPELRKYGYPKRLSTGVLAASGTLGILIPPSLAFIFYGILTDVSIAKLFIAGIVPGVITIFIFSTIVVILVSLGQGPNLSVPRYSMVEKWRSTKGLIPILLVFILVIGSLYGGITTPTEASGIGAIGTLVVAGIMKRLTWARLRDALLETCAVSGFIFIIIVGGYLIARFLVLTGVTDVLTDFALNSGMSRYTFIIFLVLLYFILGAMLDVFGMVILTLPFLFPIVQQLGIDPIWFGVFIVVMSEVALITPPIGVNVFVMADVARDASMIDIFKGVMPFLLGEFILIAMLVMWPSLALWLPGRM